MNELDELLKRAGLAQHSHELLQQDRFDSAASLAQCATQCPADLIEADP